jgi:hypothetical protein
MDSETNWGVSTQPSGSSKTRAMEDGIGYSGSIICCESNYSDVSLSKARPDTRDGVRGDSEGKEVHTGWSGSLFPSPLTGPRKNVPRTEYILVWSPGTWVGQPWLNIEAMNGSGVFDSLGAVPRSGCEGGLGMGQVRRYVKARRRADLDPVCASACSGGREQRLLSDKQQSSLTLNLNSQTTQRQAFKDRLTQNFGRHRGTARVRSGSARVVCHRVWSPDTTEFESCHDAFRYHTLWPFQAQQLTLVVKVL